ncbi:MAG: GrdX family protein [Clostridia bacterium]|nr:GrdX family protein [Clostridia bacterium]
MGGITIITNNSLAAERFGDDFFLLLLDTDYEGILKAARDRIHTGWILLTHPLSGSVKPRETPYKSLLLKERRGPVDEASLSLIENALAACRKFEDKASLYARYREDVLTDFRLIDAELIAGAIASIEAEAL